ncbi:MAG: hypothetical protein AAF480_08605 [Actinomycetota bacterium]
MSRLINAEAQELAELAAVLAEGARLSRGRQYQKRGQVTDLMVEPEAVTASVHGSRDEPYDVTIACKAAGQNERSAAAVDPTAVVPKALDIAFTCHCPDWGDPCKHGVAVLLEFAREVDDDPSLLLRWRGIDDLTPPPPAGTESLNASPAPAPTPQKPDRSPPRPTTERAAVPTARNLRTSPVGEAEQAGTHQADVGVEAEVGADDVEIGGPLDLFFGGAMPDDGTLLGPLEEVQLDAYGAVRIEVENVDLAPVLEDALDAIADHWLSR